MKITKKSATATVIIATLLGLIIGSTSGKVPSNTPTPNTKSGALFTPENFAKPENQLLAEIVNLAIEKTR